MARPPDLPIESMAKKCQPREIEFKVPVMRLAEPRVSYSKIMSIGSISISLRSC